MNFAKSLKIKSVYILIALCLVFSQQTALCKVPVSATLARFDFIEVDYSGEMYDANELSQGMFQACADEHMCGYINENGKTAVDFSFAYAGSFGNGLAPAKVRYGKFGYIDKTGLFAIEPQFDEANDFSNGLALVRKGSKTGFIDKTGRFTDIIKDASYTPVTSFRGGVCWVENENGMRAVMNSDGTLLTDFSFVWSGEFSDGVCWASKDTGSDFNHISMGLIDKNGNFIIEPGKYTDCTQFHENMCWAKKNGSDKIFLIDMQGNEISSVPGGYMPSDFSNGICVNVGGDLLSVMNVQGVSIWSSKTYLPIHYGGFHEGKMLVRRTSDGKYFIMRDLYYKPSGEEENIISGYEYEKENGTENSFEIALLINSPEALVNGTKTMIDINDAAVYPFVENSRTLLPMRFITENVPDCGVTWDYLTNSALVQANHVSILLKADSAEAKLIRYMPEMRGYEQHTKLLDQPPVNAHDRLFLPVRALCEMIGVNVFYDLRGLVVISNTRSALGYDDAGALISQLNQ